MTGIEPDGPYVFQPFAPATHPGLGDRIFGVSGFGCDLDPRGLTKAEAEALCSRLRELLAAIRLGVGAGAEEDDEQPRRKGKRVLPRLE